MGESVVLTFENVYEVLRREKGREDLQKLDETFFTHVSSYISEKRASLAVVSKKNDIFSHKEKENINLQLVNIKKVLKDLYDQREQKIISLALNKSKTNSSLIDTAQLLPKEKQMFEKLSKQLNEYRDEFFNLFEENQEYPVIPEEQKTEAINENTAKDNVKVEFLTRVDTFIGRELEEYGPFDEGDTTELPKELAEILVNEKKVTKIA
ncbi:hypothetical protein HZA97_05065 [Candidatus Woesearchaeota archaeon]|nr:hypothetical protein [Candidatus Woesearchaeota archaeon]